MEASKTIVHEIGGIQNDAFRFGLHGVNSDLVGSHPLEAAYHATRRTHEEMNRKVLTNTYGSAFPLKMDLDNQILSGFFLKCLVQDTNTDVLDFLNDSVDAYGGSTRPLQSVLAMTGSLDKIYFEDYLNDYRDSKSVRPYDMHHGMEVRNGLSKGPICPSFI